MTFMDSDVSNLAAMNSRKYLLNVMKVHGKQSLCQARESLGLKLSLLISKMALKTLEVFVPLLMHLIVLQQSVQAQ